MSKGLIVWEKRLGQSMLVMLLMMALPVQAQLMLAHEGHHSGDCSIKTGAFPVNFSAYEPPKGSLPPMHAFCDHVPTPGDLNITVDLTDLASREIPIAVRLVMEGHGEGGHELMSIPAQAYESGSITFPIKLSELGQYALLLETEKDGKLTTAVRIPIHVGGDGGHSGHGGGSGPGMMEIALLLGVGGVAAYFWSSRKKKTD